MPDAVGTAGIADQLSRHEPFAGLDADALAQVAGQVEIERFAAGDVIFEQGHEPAERVRMVVRGAVELLDHGRTLDLLGEGELFGHPSMLAGLPTGFAARAHEETLCYRLPTALLVPLLTRPEGLRFVARSLLARRRAADGRPAPDVADPARRPVGALLREETVVCEPTATVRQVARQMADRGASCALIRLPAGELGIVTDQDLRVRVVAGDVPLDATVDRAMTAPAFTVSAATLATDVMVEMIDRGIRHVPVLGPRGEVLGVVADIDLLAADTRSPFVVRRAIARAGDLDALVAAAQALRPTAIALHDAEVAPLQLAAIISAFGDALTRRALELLGAGEDGLPPLAWLVSGSMGRHEALPSSDVDSVLAWDGPDEAGDRLRTLAGEVLEVLERCGFRRDDHAASAANPLFARSTGDWRAAIARWLDRPEDSRLLIVVSVLADTRVVYGRRSVGDPLAELRQLRGHPVFLGQIRRMALAHRPPTGFLRDIVVEHSGERRGLLDIKNGGLRPIVDLARYYGLRTGTTDTTTLGRLRAAAADGVLGAEEAATLEEAFALMVELRMDHQIGQLRDGREATDFLDPADLGPLTRRYLREAFRATARLQRRLSQRGGA